jgi:eukaryotic-like serine/threonine-protein kinase
MLWEKGCVAGQWPWFLPDGRHFLFLSTTQQVKIGSLDSKVSTLLVDSTSNAAYSQGYALYLREDSLMAQPFDRKKLTFSGEPSAVLDRVRSIGSLRRGVFTVSQNGLLAYQSGGRALRLTWFDREGRKLGDLGDPADIMFMRLSPDGKTAAATLMTNHTWDLWLYDVERGLKNRLTFMNATIGASGPVWSPDGRNIVFNGMRAGKRGLLRKAVNGSSGEELLLEGGMSPRSWSPDGAEILIVNGGLGEMTLLPVSGDHKLKPFGEITTAAEFSPDGHWIACASGASGQSNIYLQPFLAGGGKIQVSNPFGILPHWRRDGKELLFLSGTRLMSAELIPKGGTLQVGRVQPLLGDVTITTGIFDVTPDGQRFLIAMPVGETGSEPLTLLQNWTAALKK